MPTLGLQRYGLARITTEPTLRCLQKCRAIAIRMLVATALRGITGCEPAILQAIRAVTTLLEPLLVWRA